MYYPVIAPFNVYILFVQFPISLLPHIMQETLPWSDHIELYQNEYTIQNKTRKCSEIIYKL